MRRSIILVGVVVGIFSLCLWGCKEKKEEKVIKPPTGVEGEKLLWSTHKGRPAWVQSSQRTEGEFYLFVGQSEKFALEKGARDAAYRDAIKQAGIYINTSAVDSFQKLLANHNVESQIIDRTTISREFEEQLSKALVKKARVKEYYEEQRQDKSGQIYWMAFALLEVPVSSIDETYKNVATQSKEEITKEYEMAKDKKGKEQLKSAMDAFDEANERGFKPTE
ncbi:MAG: hypothetical protein ABIF11_06195 [Nitrospirota bacterium]